MYENDDSTISRFGPGVTRAKVKELRSLSMNSSSSVIPASGPSSLASASPAPPDETSGSGIIAAADAGIGADGRGPASWASSGSETPRMTAEVPAVRTTLPQSIGSSPRLCLPSSASREPPSDDEDFGAISNLGR